MVGSKGLLSLALPLVVVGVHGLDLDVNKPGICYGFEYTMSANRFVKDSIKAAAKSLASGIIASYDASLKNFGAPGLFEDYYWWEAGSVFNGLIEYSYLTGDHQYDTKIADALQWQVGDLDAFMPPNQTKTLGNDDQSSWALAAMTAAEVGFQQPRNSSWLNYAKNVFDTQTLRWDDKSCSGGLRWQIFSFNNGYNYKSAWANGNYMQLAARLAKFTGNMTYAQYADKSFKWATDIGLVSKDFSVFDGADTSKNCSVLNKIRFSLPHSAYTEGATLMANLVSISRCVWEQC